MEQLLDFILKIFAGVFIPLLTYNFIDVGKKRKIETYWKIESDYKSPEQQQARKSVELVDNEFARHMANMAKSTSESQKNDLISYYDLEFHHGTDSKKRYTAWQIRTRLRFLHLCGVLLRKRMIDKDLLFSLIGLGFEIDYETLGIILEAHRKSHNTPYLYNHFEFLWNEYQRWKSKLYRVS